MAKGKKSGDRRTPAGQRKAGKGRRKYTAPPSPTGERLAARAAGEQQFYAPIGEHELVLDVARGRVVRSCTKAPKPLRALGRCASEQTAEVAA